MKTTHRRGLWLAGLGWAALGLTGCQVWQAGMTLPSGRYLEHRPQYFPPDPDFPLSRELATMAEQNSLAAGPATVGARAGTPQEAAPGGAAGTAGNAPPQLPAGTIPAGPVVPR